MSPESLSATGFRTRLQVPGTVDEKAFLTAMRASVGLHYPWVTAPKDHATWKRYLARIRRDNEAGFLLRHIGTDAICGVINMNIITYEALCSAYISYYGVAGQTERGYMKEGLLQVINHAFDELGLHRLEANIQPQNLASIALVQSVGFHYEGYSPRYLRISGEWCDHERWALVCPDISPRRTSK